MRLADLGVDSSSRLDALVQAGMITPQVQALAQATAAAVARPPLRPAGLAGLSDTDDMAATKMIESRCRRSAR